MAIANLAPVITSLTGDTEINEGDTASFNAIVTDAGDDTLTYTWDFGDGSDTATGADTAHTYADNGDYTVTLTVTDGDGGESVQTLTVRVSNVAPSFTNIDGKTTVDEGEAVDYSATATDPGADELSYAWNFGDDTAERVGAEVTHTFTQNGVYDATLVTVTDDDGAATTSNLTITVLNVAPTLDTEATKIGFEGMAVDFEATFDDVGNDDLTVTWDFGDGSDVVSTSYTADSEVTTETKTHTYAADGLYTATVTVTDSDGAVTESTVQVAIANVAPVIESLTGDTEINEGDTASFSAVATDAGNDELTYTWDFGDGSEQLTVNSDELPVSHTYADNGNYTVTLTATDTAGATDTKALDVVVNNTVPVITNLIEDLVINEGDAASLSVTATDAGNDELTYAWDFGDGSGSVMGQNAEHIFVDNGLYEASVTVTDDDGAAVTQSLSITVNNVAPIIDPWSDQTTTEGDVVEFNASFSDPGILDTHTITWDFGDDTSLSDTSTPSHIYADDGIYQVKLTITDNDGGVSSSSLEVTVNNAAPSITSLTGDTQIDEGDTASFSITATDPGADELNYTWDFGDGNTATGTGVSHTYTENGSYIVTATVRDDDGAATSSTMEIQVNNVAPVITNLTGDSPIDEGDRASFSVIATDAGNDELTYTWNFGDGSETVTGQDASHTFADNGSYTVELTVTDDDGAATSKTLEIQVDNVAPTIVDFGTEINEGETLTLNALATDPGADELTYTWDFGDNTEVVRGLEANHVYADNGEYVVKLTVTDDDGAETEQYFGVKVLNVTPVITELTGDTQIEEGGRARFSASATDAGRNDKLTYTWNFGDDERTFTGKNIAHTYVNDGDYTVTLTVTDDDGAATTQTHEIRVNNTAPVITELRGDTQIDEGGRAHFSASATDAGRNDKLTYTWNFGDDERTFEGKNIAHTYVNDGDYTVTLTVTDDDGAVTTKTHNIRVNNTAPVITELTGDTEIDEGDRAHFSASATDAGRNDKLTYTWNFGDGQTATGKDAVYTFPNNGEYTVELTVTDDDGAATSQSLPVTVNEELLDTPKPGLSITTEDTPGVYRVTGSADTAIDLNFNLIGQNAEYRSEIGIIVLDGEGGRIDNLLPGESGYTEAALSSNQKYVLFEPDREVGTLKQLSLNAEDQIMFYMVQNDSSANVLRAKENAAPVFFSGFSNLSNSDRFDHFQTTVSQGNEMIVGIEDLVGGGDRDFDDVVLSVTPTQLSVPGASGETVSTTAVYEGKSAQLDSEVGLVVYENNSASVNNLLPGDAGYVRAAMTSLDRHLLFDASSVADDTKTIDLAAGQTIGLYVVVGGIFTEWLEYNPDNLPSVQPYILFDHPLANPDGINHFNRLGNGEYGIEDLLNGGDRDFNDLRIRLQFE